MPSKQTLVYFIILLLLIPSILEAQYRRKKFDIWQGFRVAPRGGVNIFYGDLVDKSRTNFSLGVIGERELTSYLSGRVQLMGGQMKGEQVYGETDEIYAHFENFYTDFSIGASFRPLDVAFGYFKQRSFNPYVIGQLGIIQYNTTEYYGPAAGPRYERSEDHVWRKKAACLLFFPEDLA